MSWLDGVESLGKLRDVQSEVLFHGSWLVILTEYTFLDPTGPRLAIVSTVHTR